MKETNSSLLTKDILELDRQLQLANLPYPFHQMAYEIFRDFGLQKAIQYVTDRTLEVRSTFQSDKLREKAVPYKIIGEYLTDRHALLQMNNAARLPIAERAALMADAYLGYGSPIGAVIATKHSYIPYAVGSDIGCGISISLYDIKNEHFNKNYQLFVDSIIKNTFWGNRNKQDGKNHHAILDGFNWNINPFIKGLRDIAIEQLGTSGGGNHFVNMGFVDIFDDNHFISHGHYFAIMCHVGSRRIGSDITDRYASIAIKQHPYLDVTIRNLSWLNNDSSEGIEYYNGMNLALDYAKANHEVIHNRIQKFIGEKPLFYNFVTHKFLRKEKIDGSDYYIHRKGAFESRKSSFGIVTSNMSDTSYLVSGKGDEDALNSSSHGCGRVMSKVVAFEKLSHGELESIMNHRQVNLLGGCIDEAPQVFKPIDAIIASHADSFSVFGKFKPKIVRMENMSERSLYK